jgi:hypothetical protein
MFNSIQILKNHKFYTLSCRTSSHHTYGLINLGNRNNGTNSQLLACMNKKYYIQ